MTVSIGLFPFRTGEPLEVVYHKADEAMYRAKGEGRDRIYLAERAWGPVLETEEKRSVK